MGSPGGRCVLELLPMTYGLDLLNGAPRTERWGSSVWTQELWGTNRPGCLGTGSRQVSPWQGSDGERSLEAGQPHLVGIEFDMCFQTWLQPRALSWVRAVPPVDSAKPAIGPLVKEPGRWPPTWPGVPALCQHAQRHPPRLSRASRTFSFGEARGKEAKESHSLVP